MEACFCHGIKHLKKCKFWGKMSELWDNSEFRLFSTIHKFHKTFFFFFFAIPNLHHNNSNFCISHFCFFFFRFCHDFLILVFFFLQLRVWISQFWVYISQFLQDKVAITIFFLFHGGNGLSYCNCSSYLNFKYYGWLTPRMITITVMF